MGIDVSIIYVTTALGMGNITALMLAVTISSVAHYVISRYWVFRSFQRHFLSGYIHFVSVIGLSIILNSALYLVLVALLPLPFVLLRIISIALVGVMSYILNAHYTFGAHAKKQL